MTVTFYAQENVIHDHAHQLLFHETKIYDNARLNKSRYSPYILHIRQIVIYTKINLYY